MSKKRGFEGLKSILGVVLVLGFLVFLGIHFQSTFTGESIYDVASSEANPGDVVNMVKFNISSGYGYGNTWNNITVNNTGSTFTGYGYGHNVTNVTVSNGTLDFYNDSFNNFPVKIDVNNSVGADSNFTVDFTLNSSATIGESIQANVTSLKAEENVTKPSTPFSSGSVSISSSASDDPNGYNIKESFNNSKSSESLVYSGRGNYTRYLTLPVDARVNSANVDVEGFETYGEPEVSSDWTKFRKYDNNTAYTPSTKGPERVSNKIGEFAAPDKRVKSSPAVTDKYVYLGSRDDNLYQLNSSDISQKIHEYSTGSWIRSSPAVTDKYVYVGSNDNNVYQLNASNISQKIHEYSTGNNIRSSPAVTDKYVYVGSDDNNIYQLNASNISQKIHEYSTGSWIKSSPAVTDKYVYVGSNDNNVYQLNASNISQKIHEYSTGYDVRSSPAVTDKYVYIGSGDSKVYQLNASNISDYLDSFDTGAFAASSPAVTDNYVYVGSDDNHLYKLGGKYREPNNPYLNLGRNDGSYDWNYSGRFSGTNSTNFTNALSNALSNNCSGGTLEGGNCTVSFLFHSDSAGKLKYSSLDVNWTEPSPSDNGSSGSSRVSSSDDYSEDRNETIRYSKKWSLVESKEQVKVDELPKSMALERVYFGLNSRSEQVKLEIISTLKRDEDYERFNLNGENMRSLNSLEIEFKVENDWVSENGLSEDEIAIYKQDSGKWKEVETSHSSSGSEYSYYTAKLDSLGEYSIRKKSLKEEGGQTEEDKESSTSQEDSGKEDSGEERQGSFLGLPIWSYILAGVVILGLVAWIIFSGNFLTKRFSFKRRGKSKNVLEGLKRYASK